MHRRSFLRSSGLALGSGLVFQQQLLAQLLQQPPFKIQMIRENLGIFTERGGTIGFLLTNEGIVVVDSQFPEQSQHLIDELKKKSDKPFRLLINTHHHGDHSSGNISFKGAVQHVLAHSNSKANQERVAKEQKTEDKQLFPDQVYGDIWSEKIGKEKITLHYYGAGHTNGDSLIHFEHNDVVHMGDLMFNRRYPFVDRSSGASIKGWISILEKADKKFSKKTSFIFGHAHESASITGGKEDLKLMKEFFEKLLAFTESEFKAGRSKEEFLKSTAIPGVTEWKGDGIQRPLGAAWDEVSGA
ncbi:MAG TPA: MBL fold metallo-hydrolase [Chitinophagaceae bacterium]|nr:MBL fold metallo-hydrolase [Chitinophagaceae bacterium]